MNEENSNIENISEEDPGYSNDDLFNITSWGADLSFRELITKYKEEELLKPELQRKYVWSKLEASRLIESILLGLPIPSIFLAKTNDQKQLIIDGYQRIMTVYDYAEKKIFTQDNKIFKLVNSEKINERWRGKGFDELDEADQRKIKSSTIHAIIFEQRHPKNSDSSLYQIFERINTGGKVLKQQEIRNCAYQGPLNTLLFELNKNVIWRRLFGLEEEDSRMSDIEFILRFFTLSQPDIIGKKNGQISLKKYLNDYMGDPLHNDKEFIDGISINFTTLMDKIFKLFGENAFRNISKDGSFLNKFHPTIFDSISISTNYALQKGIDLENISDLKIRQQRLLNDPQFKDYTTIRTTNYENINGRINAACNFLYGINYE